jgi:hypothetical protein
MTTRADPHFNDFDTTAEEVIAFRKRILALRPLGKRTKRKPAEKVTTGTTGQAAGTDHTPAR